VPAPNLATYLHLVPDARDCKGSVKKELEMHTHSCSPHSSPSPQHGLNEAGARAHTHTTHTHTPHTHTTHTTHIHTTHTHTTHTTHTRLDVLSFGLSSGTALHMNPWLTGEMTLTCRPPPPASWDGSWASSCCSGGIWQCCVFRPSQLGHW
jgi:hypothetical protein